MSVLMLAVDLAVRGVLAVVIVASLAAIVVLVWDLYAGPTARLADDRARAAARRGEGGMDA
ncbi:hypothetical protein ACXET9_07105 [Brachybacterium sp. DNPG3]